MEEQHEIYNSRNYSILLNIAAQTHILAIYNSRNYSILLNLALAGTNKLIYNSRNYSILLNEATGRTTEPSTTVEIILYYLTAFDMNVFNYLQQ